MSLLFAAVGPVHRGEWGAVLEEAAEFPLRQRVEWESDDGLARLCSVGGTFRTLAAEGLSAIASGELHGNADVASTALGAYRDAGVRGLASLRGEYVVAIWDARSRCLLVACDAVGLRAPAYRWDGTAFMLSSRALALLRPTERERTWDAVYMAHALSGLWSRTASATAFGGVRRMCGGDLLRISERGLEHLPGDRLVFADRVDDSATVVRELGVRLDEAVEARAGAPGICVALSGGVDSGVVAAALARRMPHLDAFSLVASPGASREDPALGAIVTAIPGLRHHRVELTGDGSEPLPLADDLICGGLAFQVGRVALLRAARDMGLRRVFDGEGGDELFDLAWRPADALRERALGRVVSAMTSRASRARLVNDLAGGGSLGGLSYARLRQLKRALRGRRPWLRDAFWSSVPLEEAWTEATSFWRVRTARERLPEILGAHARYWRAQSVARMSLGIEGVSPLIDRRLVELVGSTRAEVATDAHHGKALLRRVAAARLASEIAWRPKSEPLGEWLNRRTVSEPGNLATALGRIRASRMLGDYVDPAALTAAVDSYRQAASAPLAHALVELFALVEWASIAEQRYRVRG